MASKTPIAAIVIDEKTGTPETCPSTTHWNRDDNLSTDIELNSAAQSSATTRTAFRDHLSPTMQTELAFEYYEVRPCIERDRQIASYADEQDYAADLRAAQASAKEFRTFWSLYGIDAGAHTAIGDFVSKDAAHEVMNAILAVPAAARNAIYTETAAKPRNGADSEAGARAAADWLDDMINQSSNDRRI